jgi:hypothetical protein
MTVSEMSHCARHISRMLQVHLNRARRAVHSGVHILSFHAARRWFQRDCCPCAPADHKQSPSPFQCCGEKRLQVLSMCSKAKCWRAFNVMLVRNSKSGRFLPRLWPSSMRQVEPHDKAGVKERSPPASLPPVRLPYWRTGERDNRHFPPLTAS